MQIDTDLVAYACGLYVSTPVRKPALQTIRVSVRVKTAGSTSPSGEASSGACQETRTLAVHSCSYKRRWNEGVLLSSKR